MATKVLSIEEKLQNLYKLQLIDSKIDQIEILKGELPIEVSDLEDEIQGLDTRIKKINSAIEEIDKGISNHKLNIKQSEALIERYERQLDEVKNNREYDALTKEIQLQKLDIQLYEKKINEAERGRETKAELHQDSETKLESKNKDLDIKKVELEKIIVKTNKEEIKLKKESDKAQKTIEDRFLKAYKKIRSRYRNGLAVVKVMRDACGGCYNRIPPQMQIEIGQKKNIIACEHCGRVLIDDVVGSKVEAKYS